MAGRLPGGVNADIIADHSVRRLKQWSLVVYDRRGRSVRGVVYSDGRQVQVSPVSFEVVFYI